MRTVDRPLIGPCWCPAVSGNAKFRKAISLMVLASYLVPGTILHWFHNHPTCGAAAVRAAALRANAECCGCDHDCHDIHAHACDLDGEVAQGESEQEERSRGERFEATSVFGSRHAHCAVCRFLSQSSTPLIAVAPTAIGQAKPRYVVSEPSRSASEPVGPWHSRAPPLFAEI